MQRLRVAYNCGCRSLYNLPWQVGVNCHQVQCSIPAFEALLKNVYLFPEQCRKSNNTYVVACFDADSLYSSLGCVAL